MSNRIDIDGGLHCMDNLRYPRIRENRSLGAAITARIRYE